jgi:peptidoglycan hydrolase-like protein with peptidoglycan-binding domain
MSWRTARALDTLLREVNDAAPNRSKKSDGSIGDAAHRSRGDASDHNPWVPDPAGIVDGVVTARDFTDDDAHGADMAAVVRYLTQESRDPRIKYLIHNRKIYSSYPTSSTPAWAARPYSGTNAHEQHLHVSVRKEPRYFDDARPWGIAAALAPKKPAPGHAPGGTVKAPAWPLKPGRYFGPRLPLWNIRSVSGYFSHSADLRRWQLQMRGRGWDLKPTGRFDDATQRVVRQFQKEKRLEQTGHIWPATWAAAWTAPVTK